MLIIALTCLLGAILLLAMAYAYGLTRDPLHPAMFLGPLCIYAFVYKPLSLNWLGAMQVYFDDRELIYVQLVNIAGVLAFCIGVAWHCRKAIRCTSPEFTQDAKMRALEVALLLGGIAVAAFWVFTLGSGGLGAAYGQAKGGVNSSSGYLGELPMLSLPAIALLFFAWSGHRIGLGKIAILFVIASPLLIHGLLGARRGPTFMIFAALALGHYAVSSQRPKLPTVLIGTFAVGMLVVFLLNNRYRIALSSSALDRWTSIGDETVEPQITNGEDWIFSSGVILTSRDSRTHFWGKRFLVNALVRPVPRQLWPDKYAASGFGWLDDQSEMHGMSDDQWVAAVGWVPARGAAAGFVADFYLEFWLFGFIGCFALGWVYSFLWRMMVSRGGVWSMLYLYGCILSIYVPTQNVTEAWLYRFLLFAVPTILIWRIYIAPSGEKQTRVAICPVRI